MLQSAQAALYQQCVTKAANEGKQLMEHLVDKGRGAIQQRASIELDPQERQVLVESGRQLSAHEGLLRDRFPMTLMAAFSEAISTDARQQRNKPSSPTPGASIRFDELELMDESQVQESIELARAQQTAMAVAELQLAELNALICSVLGLKTVQPDRNPFRPEIYVKALRTVLKLTNADNAVRVRWMQFMGVALGDRLRETYADLSTMLQSNGVRPVGYVVTQTAHAGNPATAKGKTRGGAGAPGGVIRGFDAPRTGGTGGMGGSGGGTGAGSPAGGGTGGRQYGEQALLTVDQLRRLLAGELDSARQGLVAASNNVMGQTGGSRGGAGGTGYGYGYGGMGGGGTGGAGGSGATDYGDEAPPDFGHTVPAAFDALEEMRQVDHVLKRLADRKPTGAGGLTTGSPGLDTTLENLRRDAKGMGQALGLEVVNLMFENIAQDQNLLPPVQAVLRRVEPAYLRLALIDPRFFSDKQHVARRLLERMTERSLAYATIVTPGFDQFVKSMRDAAEVLAISQIKSTDPFEYALKTLEADWQQQEQRENKQRDKAVHALLHAEQRNLLAERLAGEMRGKPGASMAPAEVLAFLCGPWAQVLAEARLADRKGATDPGGYMGVANDLIWTTQPEQKQADITRIQNLIPAMLERLAQGLRLIDFPQPQVDAFGMVLMGIYDNVLKPPKPGERRKGVTRGTDHAATRLDGSDTNDPWLGPTEMQDTGFLDVGEAQATHGSQFKDTESSFESTTPQAPDGEEDAKASERSKPPIPAGAWVELSLHDQTLRAQLTWSSPYGTLFMFTDAAGTTHSLTRRALDKLLARGSVTVISQGVVEEALDAVAQKALRNSLDLDLNL
ncbi:DUF1631 family protein [Variovorax sp. VNK109]|uniref:DUF1631 family protein n=1 Tax=Variovorax sp. VNK109 TaxID=3400919 RepID=UPI003C09C0ED